MLEQVRLQWHGTFSCMHAVGLSPKTVMANAMPSMIATGVRSNRFVTSCARKPPVWSREQHTRNAEDDLLPCIILKAYMMLVIKCQMSLGLRLRLQKERSLQDDTHPDRPDAVHIGVRVFIDDDSALLVELHAHCLRKGAHHQILLWSHRRPTETLTQAFAACIYSSTWRTDVNGTPSTSAMYIPH